MLLQWKRGYFAKVFRSRDASKGETTTIFQKLHAVGSLLNLDQNVNGTTNIVIQLNGEHVNALFERGATDSHLSEAVAKGLNLQIINDLIMNVV